MITASRSISTYLAVLVVAVITPPAIVFSVLFASGFGIPWAAAGGISLVLGVCLGVQVARRIVIPARRLATGAREIASGGFDRLLNVGGPAELTLIADHLIMMSAERAAAEQALTTRSNIDELTGLVNRSLVLEGLGRAIEQAAQANTQVALMLIDLDRFKEVNDALGHQTGDELLRQSAHRLHDALRSSDVVGRLGGDEFAVVLPATSVPGAVIAATKLIGTQEQPFTLQGHRVSVSASIGIAIYPDHGPDSAALMRCADVAMYNAKRSGRGYALYTPEHDSHGLDRLGLVGDLRHAINNDELELWYQPKVDVSSRALHGVEALIRWRHPEKGLIAPDQFIPLAEETGLIRPLSRWVVHAALEQIEEWRAVGIDVPVAINLSMQNLDDAQLPDMIADAFRHRGLEPSCLTLELTESAIMVDSPSSMANVHALAALGVCLSIDDFGTGYSSLAHLSRLPVSQIKIDRSFVTHMASNANNRTIVQATVNLARSLGMQVVAEGVEDEATLTMLGVLGCEVAQGYHVHKPAPAPELAPWLRANTGFFRLDEILAA